MHPLELGNFPLEANATLKAQFEVMVARVPGVKLAGSARIEDALLKSAAAHCEVRDSCLRFLAEATDSLYGMYARVDPASTGVVGSARVVRADGVTVRKVRIDADNPHQALVLMLSELKLDSLEPTLPAVAELPLADLSPPPLPPPASEPMGVYERPSRAGRVAGWTLVGVGGATLITGGVFAGLAASRAAANRPDASGAVSAERAAGAATALRQSNIAAVVIPAGAALTAVGAILVLWPATAPAEHASVRVGFAPSPTGFAASLTGALP